jgi:hexosaminidase
MFTGTVYGQISTQEDLDGIAKNIQIKVDVADNLQFNGGKHLFRVTFENKGSRSLSGTNWKIYFFSFFVIEADHIMSADGNYILPEGYVLEDSKLKINHEKGSLYSLSPVAGFPEISPNTTKEITFFGANWAISKSDVPPNWYIDADGLSPRVFESTSGDFVRDFTEPSQWKRTKYDLYNPYTPMDRFERYKKISLQPKMKLSIPTPKEIIEHDDTVTLDMRGDVNIVHNNLSNEAVFLSSKYLEYINSFSQCYTVNLLLFVVYQISWILYIVSNHEIKNTTNICHHIQCTTYSRGSMNLCIQLRHAIVMNK